MRIAYQGEPGAFSEAAARRVDADAQLHPCRSFEEVFEAVEGGPAGYGVLPIENSIGGSIHRNYDLLLAHEIPIVAEVEVPVVHHLLALPTTTLDALKKVYSHPQALAQCERFLRKLSGVEIVATYDTAGSAKMVADQQLPDAAAIASSRAGELFGLTPLASSIQDYDDNITRFLVIGRRPLKDAVADLRKPLIGVANTWIEIGPCNFHLRDLAVPLKDAIREAGGTPMEFNTVSISDGITMGTEGMRASLVSREVIADSIELVARGNGFDG